MNEALRLLEGCKGFERALALASLILFLPFPGSSNAARTSLSVSGNLVLEQTDDQQNALNGSGSVSQNFKLEANQFLRIDVLANSSLDITVVGPPKGKSLTWTVPEDVPTPI